LGRGKELQFIHPQDDVPDKSGSGWQSNRQPRRDGHCPSARHGNINADDHWSSLPICQAEQTKYLNVIRYSSPLSP